MFVRPLHTGITKILLAVWIVVPILSAVHAAAESHRYCAQHQAVEEAHGHATQAADLPAEEASDDTKTRRGEPPSHSEDHAACAFGHVAVEDSTSANGFDDAAKVPPTSEPGEFLASQIAVASFRLHRLAPKTSPPVLG